MKQLSNRFTSGKEKTLGCARRDSFGFQVQSNLFTELVYPDSHAKIDLLSGKSPYKCGITRNFLSLFNFAALSGSVPRSTNPVRPRQLYEILDAFRV
jgi:hypothetical protein